MTKPKRVEQNSKRDGHRKTAHVGGENADLRHQPHQRGESRRIGELPPVCAVEDESHRPD